MEKWAELQNKKKKQTITTASQSTTTTPTVITTQATITQVETPVIEVKKVIEAPQPTYQVIKWLHILIEFEI
jgi:hypothetical protein